MKTIPLLVCLVWIVFAVSHTKINKQRPKNTPELISSACSQDFITTIQPILQNNCSPCHFPGGKMYISMPFDKVETIISHDAGVTKRFRNIKEGQCIITFLEKNKMY